ncbi:MAG: Gfo/Idh/MocA family oxidoreductase, partial [Bryobacteraceae bacterium]|nr:Gfo/Idh/MocA family oxidoreductase [Bryobacterales bacterium]NUN04001.1 Gfo/Idh/MocA family oxidoreductase [Bryobacteraceae bacterium]
MDKVRLGLVGCGLFGERHLRAFRAVRNAEIAAVFDVDRDRARLMAAEFKIPRVCESYQEICTLPDLDAVDVVTSEEAHADPVLTALSAGKHVFVEKPLAIEIDDCTRMIEASCTAGRILMVGHILRFETKCLMLKDELDSGRLGEIVSIHSWGNRPKTLLPRYGRTHPVLENSIHDIDLMLWYTGKPVRRVRGFGRRVTTTMHPDTFWGVLEFEGGAVGIVETIWLLPAAAGIGLDDGVQLIGTAGTANIQLLPGNYNVLRETGYDVPDISYDPSVAGSVRGALRDELAYFCDCVADNIEPSVITPVEAKRAVRVALALIESAEAERDVDLTEWD